MIDQLRYDIKTYPDIFWIGEPLTGVEIDSAKTNWSPPQDILSFWGEFGSGLMFETEKILRPFAESSSVEYMTAYERDRGLPLGLTLFHCGTLFSAFDETVFVAFCPDTYQETGRFNCLDEWYIGTLRRVYSERYGLPQHIS
jgi:hypothetical protein